MVFSHRSKLVRWTAVVVVVLLALTLALSTLSVVLAQGSGTDGFLHHA